MPTFKSSVTLENKMKYEYVHLEYRVQYYFAAMRWPSFKQVLKQLIIIYYFDSFPLFQDTFYRCLLAGSKHQPILSSK